MAMTSESAVCVEALRLVDCVGLGSFLSTSAHGDSISVHQIRLTNFVNRPSYIVEIGVLEKEDIEPYVRTYRETFVP